MSIATQFQNGRLKTYSLNDVPTSATAIFTASQSMGEVGLEFLICNKDASARTVTVELYRAANTTSYALVYGKSIAANDLYRCDFAFNLLAGDQVRFKAGTATTLDAHLTVSEGIGRGG